MSGRRPINSVSNPSKSNTFRYGCLTFLAIQNSALVLTVRYSRTSSGPRYHTSTAVLLSEALKCLISLIAVLYTKHHERKHNQGPASPLADPIRVPPSPHTNQPYHRHRLLSPQRMWPVLSFLVPSTLYTIQNNLQFVAVSNLSAATFQVAYQGKILTTAICAVLFLGKRLSKPQCYSIVLLAVGVACASVPAATASATQHAATATDTLTHHHHQDHARGIAAVSLACLISGFAGVYTESILKRTHPHTSTPTPTPIHTFWHHTLHLTLPSLLTASLTVLVLDKDAITTHGFWHGYTRTVWAVIALQAVGGLTVALVITYTDNIVKGFATSVSVVLSTVVGEREGEVTGLELVGVGLVVGATWWYASCSGVGVLEGEGGAKGRGVEESEGEYGDCGSGGADGGDEDGNVEELKRSLIRC